MEHDLSLTIQKNTVNQKETCWCVDFFTVENIDYH